MQTFLTKLHDRKLLTKARDLTGDSVKQRRAVRFRLNLPVIFRWSDRRGLKQEQLGRTFDLSISGVFVLCPSPPPVGTLVDLEVHIRAFEEHTFQGLRLEGTGEVVRVGRAEETAGFAAISNFVLHEAIRA